MRVLTKITNKECFRCIGGPFPVYYVVVCVDIESELLESLIRMSLCSIGVGRGSSDSAELLKTSFGLVDGRYPVLRFTEALLQGLFEWGEPWVEFNNSCATVSHALRSCMRESSPVPSGGPAGCALMIEFTEDWLTFSMLTMQY